MQNDINTIKTDIVSIRKSVNKFPFWFIANSFVFLALIMGYLWHNDAKTEKIIESHQTVTQIQIDEFRRENDKFRHDIQTQNEKLSQDMHALNEKLSQDMQTLNDKLYQVMQNQRK